MKSETGVVLIHGAGLGSYVWDSITPMINVPTLAIDFPNRNHAGKANLKLSLDDYKNCVIEQIEQWNYRKVILVTHSIGGCVGLKVADHLGDRVIGFVAISSAVPRNGGSYLSCLPFPQAVLMRLLLKLFGTKPPAGAITKTLCNDLTEPQSEKVVQNFTAESTGLYSDRCEVLLPVAARFYVRLLEDRAFSIEIQNRNIRNLNTQHVFDLSTGHLPMMSHPKELSGILNSVINSCMKLD
jgi:pimeloyl-ACP methyl ester carboxylesterase